MGLSNTQNIYFQRTHEYRRYPMIYPMSIDNLQSIHDSLKSLLTSKIMSDCGISNNQITQEVKHTK